MNQEKELLEQIKTFEITPDIAPALAFTVAYLAVIAAAIFVVISEYKKTRTNGK